MKYFLISIFILFLGVLGALNPLRNFVNFSITPVQLGLSDLAYDIKRASVFFNNLSDLREENLALKTKVFELESLLVDLKKTEQQNATLSMQLGVLDQDPKISQEVSSGLALANVLGNPNDHTGVTVFIDKGFKSRVSVGDNVIKGSYLIGIVKDVQYNKSLVELITAPSITMSAFDIDVPNKTEGVVTGSYGTSLTMSRILQSEEINVGDTIVTLGKDGIFHPYFALGKVSEIKEISTEPLKEAYINPVLDFSNLDMVFVILSKEL